MNIEELKKVQSLEGKVAIVTGCSRPNGMGLAICKSLAIRGAKIMMTDIAGEDPQYVKYHFHNAGLGSTEQLEKAVEAVKALGTEAVGMTFDLTDKSKIQACVEKTIETFGHIDILVNNAGSLHCGPIETLTDEWWDVSYKINMKALSDFAAAVVPHMRKQGGGAIVNNTSIAGIQAFLGTGCYTATKHGAVGITKVMADEFGKDNIRVNAIAPGNVWTDISEPEAHVVVEWGLCETPEESIQMMKDMAVLGDRYTYPEDIGEAAAFLACPSSSFITGITLRVDGGLKGMLG
jgi:NAD(P)-dependent dehydrogenase (short-subunit alcohol dehydrogenase family)